MTDIMSNLFDSDFAAPAEWAAMYRAHGIQVVPARHPAAGAKWKIPALSTWKEFQNNLVPESTFDSWYGPQGEHSKRKNMGLLTGRASGNIFVVDLDDYKTGEARAWWDKVLEEHNNRIEPETWQQVTGGGGRQLLFKGSPTWESPTNRTKIKVDIRGQGGFAILPPSLHESRNHYSWKPGFAPWEIPICDAPEWLMEAIDKLVLEHAGDSERGTVSSAERTPSPDSDYNDFGSRQDGREELMRNMVWVSVIDWYRECPIKPSATESASRMSESYGTYERATKSRLSGTEPNAIKLEKENRGYTMFAEKWRRAMGQWDQEIAEEAKKPKPNQQPDPKIEFEAEAVKAEELAKADPSIALFEYLNVLQIKQLPDPQWLVSGLIIEQALGFIYGPPGCLKTFIALGMGLSFAVGMPDWWGRKIERQGAVVYVSSEGQSDLKFRIEAWEKHNQVEADESPFYLIRQTINFMKPEDIGKLLATVQAIATIAGQSVAAVFVDTVSRVLPGADENLQKDMTLFVAACDAVRQRFGATVVGVHHTSRGGNMRGSTVFPGAGDFLVEVNREEGAKHGSIKATKIKAAEDGWEQYFKVEEVELGSLGTRKSLVVEASLEPPKQGKGWPDIAMCKRVKNFIGEAWDSGEPLSNALQTKASGRYAPAVLAKHFVIEAEVAGNMIQQWLEVRPPVLSEEVVSTNTKKRGLRVVGEIT